MILASVRTKKGFHSRTAAKGCCTGSRRSLAKNGAVVAALQAVLGMGRKSGHNKAPGLIHGLRGGGRYCMLPGRGHCRGGLCSADGGRPIVVCGPAPLTCGTLAACVLLCRT